MAHAVTLVRGSHPYGRCSVLLELFEDSERDRAKEFVIERYYIFHIIANMGFWFLITGQALLMSPNRRNASRDDLVKLWEGTFIVCNNIT